MQVPESALNQNCQSQAADMTSAQKTNVNVVFGAMTFGKEGSEQARVHDLETAGKILDIFQAHGHNEIDTARAYCEGTTETMLGDLEWQKRGLVMETKYYPTAGKSIPSSWNNNLRHTPEDLRENLMTSLKELKTDKIDMWYLHGVSSTHISAICPEADMIVTA